MRRAVHACLLSVLLLARAADAKVACLVGDSLHLASVSQIDIEQSPSRTSRLVRDTLAKQPNDDPWKSAEVRDLSVPSTGPPDWLAAPDSARCAAQQAFYPRLKKACLEGVGMIATIESGECDVFLVLADATEAFTLDVATTVDQIEDLVAALDLIDAGDGVLLSAPPLLEALNGTDLWTGVFDAVRTEMVSRAIIDGPDWSPLRFTAGFDSIHLADTAHFRIADAWVRALPR